MLTISFHRTLSLLLLLLSVVCIVGPALADDTIYGEWASLRAQGKFDVLAQRLEVETEDPGNCLSVRLAGTMELVEIYSLRMVDFAAADRVIKKAEELNEQLFGADYAKNLKRLHHCRQFLTLQRGEHTGITSKFDDINSIFVFPATDPQLAIERLERVEKRIVAEKSREDKGPSGILLSAAVVAAIEAEEYEKGSHYWDLLQKTVARAEAESRTRAENFEKEQSSSVWKGLWRGIGAIYMTAGMALATWVTFGTESDRALNILSESYSSVAETYSSYQRTARLSIDSDFAKGLNLFLGYHNQVRVLSSVGALHQRRGEPDKAAVFFRQGIDISEKLRSTLNSERERIAFQSVRNDLYDRMISVLMEAGSVKEALVFSERARSRAFLDALAGGKVELREDQGRDTYSDIKRKQSELSVILANPMLSDAQVTLAEKKTRGITVKPQKTQAVTRNLIHLTSVVVPDLNALNGRLDADQAILSYFIGKYGSFAWVVTKEGIEGKPLDLDREKLRTTVAALRSGLYKHKAGADSDLLYRHLIAPFHDAIGERKLLVVPHDALHSLPFGALRQNGRYLAQDKSIYYSPSIAVWQLLRDRTADRGRRKSILLVAKPVTDKLWPELTYADREIDAIAHLYGDNAKVLAGGSATKSALRREIEGYDVLHVISHGYFDESSPFESGLVLTGGEQGILRGREIFSLQLDGKLVVLSACETARAKLQVGDEMMGLLRGFFFSGANEVIASLWMVDDESTAELMGRFHKHLKNEAPADALRLAQNELIDNGTFADPYYWAAFGAYGAEW